MTPVLTSYVSVPTVEEKAHQDAIMFAQTIIDYAKNYLGCKYKSGGKGPRAFDCSGFVGYIFKHFGIKMAASSKEQYKQGVKISNEEILPGDLVFFGGRSGKNVGHVGMVVDVDSGVIRFIHSSNSLGVTIDRYPDGGYYSERYIGAKRLLIDL